jgi:transglutaminase-like putative cysteine protease
MIAICRGWGIPARYVSGYLLTNKDESRDRSDPDASHAWVEVYLPSIGWVGIDPTNDSLAGERHIIVAIGRDYSDVPPSHGVFKGETQSQLAVGVSVRQAQSAVHEPEHLRLQKPAFPPPGRRRQTTSNLLHDQQQQQQQ